MFDATQLNMLLKWNGDIKLLPNFKFRRFVNKQKNEKQRAPLKTVTKNSQPYKGNIYRRQNM